MKRILCVLLVLCMMIPFASCTSGESTEPTNVVKLTVSYTDGNDKAQKGEIIIRLDPEQAPITVENFKKLVKEGFYDGLIFHRVISGFMIQGGDPNGDGTGGSDPIKGEFSANGVNNTISHRRGVVSMARRGDDYDSGSSQFFIVHTTSQNNTYSLDGQYAAFGYVIDGLEHVDGIASTATNFNDKPLKAAKIESAVFMDESRYAES